MSDAVRGYNNYLCTNVLILLCIHCGVGLTDKHSIMVMFEKLEGRDFLFRLNVSNDARYWEYLLDLFSKETFGDF